MSIIGRLRVLLSADSAQIVSDLGRARASVRAAGADMAESARRTSRELGDVAKPMQKNLAGVQGSVQAISQGFAALGTKLRPELASITNSIASVASTGLGPVALGLAAIGSTAFAVSQGMKVARQESDALVESIQRTTRASERLAKIRAELAKPTRQRSLVEDIDAEVKATREALKSLEVQVGNLRRSGAGESFLGLDLAGEERALEMAEVAARELQARLQNLERERVEAQRRALAERVALEKREAAERLEVVQQFRVGVFRELAAIDERRARLRDVNLGLSEVQRSLAVLERAEEAATDAARRTGADDRALAELRDRFARERSLIQDEARRRSRDATAAVDAETQELLARRDDAGKSELEQRLAELARQRDAELAAAAETGVQVAAIRSKYSALALIAREEAQRRDLDVAESYRDRLRQVETDLAFDLEQAARDETERQVAEAQRRYGALIDEARQHGEDTIRLEELLAAKVRQIREAAREEPKAEPPPRAAVVPTRRDELEAAISGGSVSEGFRARVELIDEETRSWGRLGAQLADTATYDLSDGLSQALEDVTTDARSAREAFSDLARSFVLDVSRMIVKALALRAVTAAIGGTTQPLPAADSGAAIVGAAGAPGAAHGGTYRVGGFGGIDSQLVALKVSPGELIRVSDGANSRGGSGDVHVDLAVRPPAVIADEVLAKSSRLARAEVISKTLRRPGQRGERPRD